MKRILKTHRNSEKIQPTWSNVTDHWAYVKKKYKKRYKRIKEKVKRKNTFLSSFAYFASPRSYKGKFYKFTVVGPLFSFNQPTCSQADTDIP